MEAIRKIVTVKDNVLKIVLPDSFNDKKVEVVILPAEPQQAETSAVVEEATADYNKKFYGSIKLGMTVEQIDKELKALRDEWERDIS